MEHQAWILRSLLAQLERQEAEGEEAPNGTAGEFARLKSQSTKYRTDKTYSTKTAEKPDNIKKNRYKDIVPFDHSRVKLTFTTSKNDTDYINANFIKGVSGSRTYIATQGPLPHTVLDFLRMLWEYKIKVVIMACREFELGKKKCERYWPEKREESFVCEPFTVYCDSEENKEDYLSRTLRVTYRNCSRTLKQLHYVTWPDHGVPDSIPPILQMLDEMRLSQGHDDAPICIHCSAGCGRTGALCVIDYTWNLLKKQILPPDFSIFSLVQNMRTQRPSLVQTKEQYQLVYRTVKLLFEQYLQAVDAQAHRNAVKTVPPAVTSVTSNPSDLGEELDFLPQFQQTLNEESQCQAAFPSAFDNYIAMRESDPQMDQQQWHLLKTLSESLATGKEEQEGARASPEWVHDSEGGPAVEERIDEGRDTPPLKPPPSNAVAAAICLMVEDPYFDTPMSSPSSEEVPVVSIEPAKHWTVSTNFNTPSLCFNDQTLDPPASGAVDTDEEAPPPLPQRTPESYVLAADAARPKPCEMSMLIIPPNAAAEAVRELGGSPPSPVPPLPERTPESFEIADDQASVKQKLEVTPAGNLGRIGTSSEWCGDSTAAVTPFHTETSRWVRSKSMKVRMTVSVPAIYPDLSSSASSNLHPYYPPAEQPAAPLLPPTEDSMTPPLPVSKTPESFVLTTDGMYKQDSLCHRPLPTEHPSPRIGMSSEWDGASQSKPMFPDVGMSRSKSVRAMSSTQEPFTAVQQLTPLPVVFAEGGSALTDANHTPSLNDTPGNKSDKSTEKGMSRTRSLKFFRGRQKPKATPPQPPSQPSTQPPSYSASSSVFKFGFGNRFGKPKGPRSYPETWV